MPQAVYQPENIGHFGLALAEYAHFTSPIRRYPDLHGPPRHPPHPARRHGRQLRVVARAMAALGQQCSFKERRADEATRDALSWLKCEYMRDKLGEEFDALVTGVVDFGLFVQLKGVQVDGLVHVSALRRRLLLARQLRLPHGRRAQRPRVPARRSPARAAHQRDHRRAQDRLRARANSGGARAIRGPWQRRKEPAVDE